jgi:hypothetical protein
MDLSYLIGAKPKLPKGRSFLSLFFPDAKVSPQSIVELVNPGSESPHSPISLIKGNASRSLNDLDDSRDTLTVSRDLMASQDATVSRHSRSSITTLIHRRRSLDRNRRNSLVKTQTQELLDLKQSTNVGIENFTAIKRSLTTQIADSLQDQLSLKERLKYKDAEAENSKDLAERQSLKIRNLKLELQELNSTVDQLKMHNSKTILELMAENRKLYQEKYLWQQDALEAKADMKELEGSLAFFFCIFDYRN